MNATAEQSLIAKIQALSPKQVAEVEDFVEFLSTKMRRRWKPPEWSRCRWKKSMRG